MAHMVLVGDREALEGLRDTLNELLSYGPDNGLDSFQEFATEQNGEVVYATVEVIYSKTVNQRKKHLTVPSKV